jgi:hypothetical protein
MESVTTEAATFAGSRDGSALPRGLPQPPVEPRRRGTERGAAILRAAGRFWFVVAVLGQLMFAAYITVLYGGGALRGDITVLATVMPKGYVPGDLVGNTTIVIHLMLAVLIMLGGAMQLVPQIRARAPWLHRWTGRSYIVSALLVSIGGLYLMWVRGTVGDLSQHLGTSFNAVLMVTFGVLAWRAARAREFREHRRWAMRLFLVASGVWFFRLGLMLSLIVFRRPVGFDMDLFTGPFLTALTFGQTLFPLAVLEAYFWAQERAGARGKVAVGAALAVLTVAMAAGIFAASMGMWLPRMR